MPASLSASTISGQISWWRRTYSSSYPGLTSKTHAYCAICPLAPSDFDELETEQWCVGPCSHQAFMNAAGGSVNLSLLLVFPILIVGPGSDSPSAASILRLPSRVWVTPKMVTGPVLTPNSTETP